MAKRKETEVSAEPKLGVKNVRITRNPESKVKAFCDVIIPSNDFGGIMIRNFKVVDAGKGLFVSIPNRPVKAKETINNPDTGVSEVRETGEVKYYNDIRFDSQDMYKKFRDELNKTVLEAVKARLEGSRKEEVVEV